MSRNVPASRRQILHACVSFTLGCAIASGARAGESDDEYNQPKLDRRMVRFQDHPGPDGHQCGLCTNFITPASCRVVDGPVTPRSYCLSYAPKDPDV